MFNRGSPPHEIIVELRVSFAVETLTGIHRGKF